MVLFCSYSVVHSVFILYIHSVLFCTIIVLLMYYYCTTIVYTLIFIIVFYSSSIVYTMVSNVFILLITDIHYCVSVDTCPV